MLKFSFIGLILFFRIINCSAQLPDTDIWLLDIKTEKDSVIISNPVNITNRKGYDNQPSFSPDGTYILYTSIRDEKQSDIYKYDLTTKTSKQFTNTSTSEYSPLVMPDGKNVSVVMVESDSTQRLWEFPIKGGAPELIMKDVDSIGYYCWIATDILAIISASEDPQVLSVVNITTQKPKVIANNVGRCIQKINTNTLLFVQKDTLRNGTFTELNLRSNTISKVKCDTPTLPGNEDYFFKGSIFMGNKEKIYYQDCNKKVWKDVMNLSSYGIVNIKRMTISPDGKKMVIVAETKD
ncbi:MAG: PD40 domain-containing protein [Bacteroidetes bacterium]|nr:PD40 domain-containing protein [Bacteroidota bacterium]